MGFLDWLRGKQPEQEKPKAKPPRPRVVSGLDNDSPFLVLDDGTGVTTVMDRETYDYLYGESSAPDPAQRDLEALLPAVTRVRVLAGGVRRGEAMASEALIDTEDAAALAALGRTLRISEDPKTFNHCACQGGPTLQLYAGQELTATVGLQHGRAIRWKQWKHDAQLTNGELLTRWLTDHGVEPDLLNLVYHNQYRAAGLLRGGPAPLSRVEQRLRMVEMRRTGGDLHGALVDCENVLAADPEQAYGLAVRGYIRKDLGDLAGCVADCSAAIERGFRPPEVYLTRGIAYDYLEQHSEALADCTTTLELNPNFVDAYNSRGLVYLRLGMLEQAMADLNEAIRRAPQWGLPYISRGQAHLVQDNVDAAIADYSQVIGMIDQKSARVDPQVAAMAYYNRSQCYRDKGEEQKAAADEQEAVKRNPALAG